MRFNHNTIRTISKKSFFPSNLVRPGNLRFQEHYYNNIQQDLMIMQFEYPNDEQLNNPLIKNAFETNLDELEEAKIDIDPRSALEFLFKEPRIAPFLRPPTKTILEKQQFEEFRDFVTFKNIPFIKEITLEIRCLAAIKDKYLLCSTFLILQSITGTVCQTLKSEKNDARYMLRVGNPIGCKAELKRSEDIYEFINKLSEFVLPKIKQYNYGISSQIDENDNGKFTLTVDSRMLLHFVDVQSVYDSIPKMSDLIVTFHTTSKSKNLTALLLKALKIPVNIEKDVIKVAEDIDLNQDDTDNQIQEEKIIETQKTRGKHPSPRKKK